MTLRAIVADDEELARDELLYLLSGLSDIEVVAQAANGPEALDAARRHTPDLLFLDIQMPGMDGFAVVRELAALERPPSVVFVTAFDEYAIEAFKVNAIDYLLKPVEMERLKETVARAAARLLSGRTEEFLRSAVKLIGRAGPPQISPGRLSVRQGGRFLLVDSRQVRFARLRDGIVEVVAEGGQGTVNVRTLDELEALLPGPSFVRTHRAYLVNLEHVAEVIPWFSGRLRLRMNDEKHTEVPVSRARARALRKLLKM